MGPRGCGRDRGAAVRGGGYAGRRAGPRPGLLLHRRGQREAASGGAGPGPGLRDVTRIAAGDTALWTQCRAANAGPVAEVLAAVAADLAEAARMLADGDPKSVATLLDQGQAGVARIPGKHGGEPREFTVVHVGIPDPPGGPAQPFVAARPARVNNQ